MVKTVTTVVVLLEAWTGSDQCMDLPPTKLPVPSPPALATPAVNPHHQLSLSTVDGHRLIFKDKRGGEHGCVWIVESHDIHTQISARAEIQVWMLCDSTIHTQPCFPPLLSLKICLWPSTVDRDSW